MQPMLLPDYLLGNSFNSKYKDTFIEQAPTFIYSIQDIEFELTSNGNYRYKENTEIYKPFIQWSYSNQSIGNFFIIFKRYFNKPLNLIQENSKLENYEWYNFKNEINCFIRTNGIKDFEGDLIEGAFASLVPDTDELVIVYFYKGAGKVGHLRTNLTNVKLGLSLQEHDKKILTLLKRYDQNQKNLKLIKDNIKDKYKGRFTQLPYIII